MLCVFVFTQDTTPLGRIVARFAKDMESIDISVGRIVLYTLASVSTLLRLVLTIAVASRGVFIVVLIPMLIVYMKLAYVSLCVGPAGVYSQVLSPPFPRLCRSYIKQPSVELTRLQRTTRSPLFAQFSESLHGMSTIRAYGKRAEFLKHNHELVDRHTVGWYTFRTMWFWVRPHVIMTGHTCEAC